MGMNENNRFSLRVARVSLVLFALCLSAFGCSKRDASHAAPPAAASPVVAAPGITAVSGAKHEPLAAGRALVVTAEIRVTVADVDAAVARVRAEVEGAGGYVADGGTSGKGEDRTAHFVLRVPADKLRDLRAALAGAGEIISDAEHVQDVTEERADLEARLRNARVQEKRVLEIMSGKAGTIGEVIDAERELARIRETIERLEAQKRSLDGRIDLATVNLTLSAPATSAWQSPAKSIADAARTGTHAAAAFFTYTAMALATIAPTALPFVLLGVAIAFVVRRRRAPAVAR